MSFISLLEIWYFILSMHMKITFKQVQLQHKQIINEIFPFYF